MSPDLNPVEHVWPIVLRHLDGDVYNSKDELWEALVVAFGKVTPLEILALYNSMPNRIAAVIDASGGHTKY